MPQTTFETAPITAAATARHTDDYLFDPFAPPAHLTLDLAPAENLFGDSSSEHASDPSDELLYFGAPATETTTTVQPPPMFPVLNLSMVPTHVPKVKKSRKAAEANIMKEQLQLLAQEQQQLAAMAQQQQPSQPQQFSVALPVPAPPQHLVVPAVPAASTTVLTEDDEYGGNASSDDDEEDVKPRARRATAKAAARLDDSSSGDEAPSKLKRKQMASVGVPPQRTQLTKAELELGATLDLSRDELLNMTSDALEEHAKRLASQRTLTPEEQKRFKRQRRLIKNRESAQLSRMRKKAYVDELERQIADLKEEKDEIRRRADNAERQLAQVRAETAQLRALLAQNPALAAPLSSLAVPEVLPIAVELESSKRRRGAGGVTLL